MARSLFPNSTQVPNVILDHWMAELSGTEFKVVLYVARRTYGFRKDTDSISLSQITRGIIKRDGTVLDRGTGASRSSVAAALKTLVERGLILRTNNFSDTGREYEENTYRINLDWQPGDKEGGPSDQGQDDEGNPPVRSGGGVVQKTDYPVQKVRGGWSENRTTVVQKLDPQKKDLQKTDQNPAAAQTPASSRDGPGVAAAALLVEELISQGVGRSAAAELARDKPELCRLYLEYLPFAEVRKSKGAWLTNAIRKEFGPPAAYLRVQKTKRAFATSAAGGGDAPPGHSRVGHGRSWELMRETYRRLEETQPEALKAFQEYLTAERTKSERFAKRLTLKHGAEQLALLATEEYRLEQFDRWLRGSGAQLIAECSPHTSKHSLPRKNTEGHALP